MKTTQVWAECSNKELEHNYDITDVENAAILSYSNNPLWSSGLQGMPRASLIDDGNSVRIKIGDKKINLGYDELSELTALILHCNETKIELREYQTTKSIC